MELIHELGNHFMLPSALRLNERLAEAGFAFVAASEINANERDTKDHPFGVETLPPMGLTAPRGSPPNPTFDRSKYTAIGESDRMTLRFRKPE